MESLSQTQGLIFTNLLSKRGRERVGSCQQGRKQAGFLRGRTSAGWPWDDPGSEYFPKRCPEVPPLPRPGLSPSFLPISVTAGSLMECWGWIRGVLMGGSEP